ncbi:L-cystine transmembrane transporter [Aureococcus anophagefferens]|nr:L-cystine transmembrane transporter [Aureococcus anophagefferens]
MRGAGDAEELGRTVFVRGLPWTAEEAEILALCDAARSGRVLLGNLPGDYKKAYGAPMPSHGVKAKTLMALLPGVAVGGYDPSHGLPWTAEEADVRSWMAGCGPIASLVMPLNKHDGRPSGVAFVVFEALAGAEAACDTLHGEFFPGSERWVKVAKSERPCPPARRERASSNASRDDGAGAAAAAPPSARQPAPTAADAEELGRTVFVQGLPWAAEEAEVRSWIARRAHRVLAMPRDRTGRPSGYAFVVFRKLAGAEAACDTLHKECFPGSERWVKVAKSDRPCPEYGKRKGPSKWTPTPCTASPAELRALADQAYGSKMPQHKLRMKPLLDLLPGVALGGYEPDHENPGPARARTRKDSHGLRMKHLLAELPGLDSLFVPGVTKGGNAWLSRAGGALERDTLLERGAAAFDETQVGVEAFKAKRAAKQRAKERAPRSGRETAARIQARTMRIRNLTPSGQPGLRTPGATPRRAESANNAMLDAMWRPGFGQS